MATETMVLIALKQKNWEKAANLVDEICSNDREHPIKTISSALKAANGNLYAGSLLSIWAEIRWSEINDEADFI